MAHFNRPQDRGEFSIAILCALEIESDAVEAIFDEIWDGQDGYDIAPTDQNTYTTGRIGSHNVVLAYLPGMGKVASASVAAALSHSFPNIDLGLVVGICGAVPRPKKKGEIILGDVIISTGVVQFDFGRKFTTGFKTKDTTEDRLGRSTFRIRTFLRRLRGQYARKLLGKDTLKFLKELWMTEGFETHHYPGAEADTLFKPQYLHKHKSGACACVESEDAVCDQAKDSSCAELHCDKGETIERARLAKIWANSREDRAMRDPEPLPHFGSMASGDQVIRDASYRDQLAEEKDIIAFEMEGAGMWDNFPTVVIKGVCDYADSHKNKAWHPYAAAVAAACMKAFLGQWGSPRGKDATPAFMPEPGLKSEFTPTPTLTPEPESIPDFTPAPTPEPESISELANEPTHELESKPEPLPTPGPRLAPVNRTWSEPIEHYSAPIIPAFRQRLCTGSY